MELQHENLEWNLLLLSYFHWILKIKSNIKKEVCTFQGLLAYLLTLISGIIFHQFSSVQSFGRVQFCDRPHESQHARPPCLSPTPEFTQTNVHRVGDALQPSHLLSSPSPPAPRNPSQNQGLFQWVNSSHEVAKVLKFQLQHQSFQWTPRTDLL